MIRKLHSHGQSLLFKNSKKDWHYLVQVVFLLLIVGFPIYGKILPFSVLVFDLLFTAFVFYGIVLLEKPGIALISSGIMVIVFMLHKTIGAPIGSDRIDYWLFRIDLVFLIVFFSLLGVRLLGETISVKVSKKLLYISIANYFIIGILFAFVYQLIHINDPSAFNFKTDIKYDYLYMSFIALSSVGFGEMLPLSTSAKSAVVLEAITGQLYLTFFVAIIIGKYLAEYAQMNKKNPSSD